jgi:hypothetical protein
MPHSGDDKFHNAKLRNHVSKTSHEQAGIKQARAGKFT